MRVNSIMKQQEEMNQTAKVTRIRTRGTPTWNRPIQEVLAPPRQPPINTTKINHQLHQTSRVPGKLLGKLRNTLYSALKLDYDETEEEEAET